MAERPDHLTPAVHAQGGEGGLKTKQKAIFESVGVMAIAQILGDEEPENSKLIRGHYSWKNCGIKGGRVWGHDVKP